jgi:phosphatidyl-myo-inositol dimannoside synthase
MNICRISEAFPPKIDGMSGHAYSLSRAQVEQGHHVVALQPHMDDAIDGGLRIKRLRLRASRGRNRGKLSKVAFAVRALQAYRALDRQVPFDIVHAHGDVIEAAIFGSLLHRWSKRPTVLTIHGGLSRDRRYRRVAAVVFQWMAHLIVVSNGIRQSLVDLGISPSAISVISSGVHLAPFAAVDVPDRRHGRRRLGLPETKFLAVFVGRLHPLKGVDVLAQAIRQLGHSSSIHFVVVGDGPMKEQWLSMTAGCQNVSWLGSIHRDAVVDVLRVADVFVLPSVDLDGQREGMPTSMLEAMAAGLPVVVSDFEGATEMVVNGENGFIVPQRNAAALSDAVAALERHAELRQQFGERNRHAVRMKDWSVVAANVERVYLGLLRPNDS